jgi:hypothetical protein
VSPLVAGVGTCVVAAGLLLVLMGQTVSGVVVLLAGAAIVLVSSRK